MKHENYTIGQLSKQTGVSVRRLRFYADEGLLPPVSRSAAGYRIFTYEDLARVDLIRALRNAGIGLTAIRDVLAYSATTTNILSIRLAELEAQIKQQKLTAAVLRTVLSSEEQASPENLQRIWTMTKISAADYRTEMDNFIESVAKSQKIDAAWKKRMQHMTKVELPDQPTTEQIDAWIELQELMRTPTFIQQMRENARDTFANGPDASVYEKTENSILQQADDAIEAGLTPDSEAGQNIAKEFFEGWAKALGVAADAKYWERMRRKYFLHHPNTDRYWKLIYKIGGVEVGQNPKPAYSFINKATHQFLARM